jgi:hypothetical protein
MKWLNNPAIKWGSRLSLVGGSFFVIFHFTCVAMCDFPYIGGYPGSGYMPDPRPRDQIIKGRLVGEVGRFFGSPPPNPVPIPINRASLDRKVFATEILRSVYPYKSEIDAPRPWQ